MMHVSEQSSSLTSTLLKFHSKGLLPIQELKLFHDVIDKIGDELMLIDQNGNIVYVNEAVVKGLGYSRQELLKTKITQFYKKKLTLAQWRSIYFDELKRKKQPVAYQIERVVKGGEVRIIEIAATYLKYDSRQFILSVGRDITERLLLQKHREDYDKMAALSLFVSGTAQEIKHPLDAILNHLQMMIRQYGSKDFEYIGFKEFENIMTMITNISNEIRHCCDITDKLLTLNKKRVGIKEDNCSVHDVIRESVSLISQELKSSNIKVHFKLDEKLPLASIAESDLIQVTRNIISNAIQASPSGGALFITTRHNSKDKEIYLEFKDQGVGILKENLPRVFDAFFTTKPTGPGRSAGLGLSVVYSIIKSAKGTVTISSSLRKGTIIKIFLPVFVKKNHNKNSL